VGLAFGKSDDSLAAEGDLIGGGLPWADRISAEIAVVAVAAFCSEGTKHCLSISRKPRIQKLPKDMFASWGNPLSR